MAVLRLLPWASIFFIACLRRPAVGFCNNAAGLRRAEPFSNRRHDHWEAAAATATAARTRDTRHGSWPRRNRRREGRVGELHAAFEVEQVQDLEPGCVLVAGPDTYGHMTFKAVALVYEHGEGQPTRAVCIDKGLDFTIGEMSGGDLGRLTDNRLFRGGDEGGSVAIMVHSHDISGARALGDTGLFVGGFAAALDLVDRRAAEPKEFKFFFNHLAWPDGALEEQVKKGLWKLVKLPNDVVLETKRMRDMELWGRVEFALKKKQEL
eukprot:jgi/Undpi1/11151/HiC_scaffold_30.g13449.m1